MVVDITKTPGYEVCGDNNTLWAIAAGDPNYNLLNPCCQAMNSRNPGNLGYSEIAQKVCTHDTSNQQMTNEHGKVHPFALFTSPALFGVLLSACVHVFSL